MLSIWNILYIFATYQIGTNIFSNGNIRNKIKPNIRASPHKLQSETQ